MTTSAQGSVLTPQELACLREYAQGRAIPADTALLEALAAKGMLDRQDAGYVLTPAARHALHAGEPGTVPGLDN